MKERLFILGKSFLKHELISNSIYVFIGSLIGNALAFLLNLFFARSLSYVDYGIFASLLSIITIASIPGGSIGPILVRFSTEYYSRGQIDKLKNFYEKSLKFIFSFSFVVLLLFVIFSPLIKDFLHLDNVWYAVAVGLCVVVGYIQMLNSTFLQGLMKFRFISFVTVFSSLIKLITGVILVLLGLRAFSGLGSIFFMYLTIFMISFIPLRFIFTKKIESEAKIPMKEVLVYALPAFVTILAMASFTSIDVILVKHFFNPTLAGYYSGVSLIGKVILYFTATIPAVMFPLVMKRNATGKAFNGLFLLSVSLVLIPSLLITAFYWIFPEFVISLFLGGRSYLTMAPYVGLFGLFITLFSVVNIFVNFFLSINKTVISFMVVGAALLQIVLLWIYHSDFYQIITISIFVLTLLLTILLFVFLKNFTSLAHIKKIYLFLIPQAPNKEL
jgi:O-antigen/teichoic acid export membrane protein